MAIVKPEIQDATSTTDQNHFILSLDLRFITTFVLIISESISSSDMAMKINYIAFHKLHYGSYFFGLLE